MIDIQEIIAIAKKAGEKILSVYNTEDFGVQTKDDHFDSPITKADFEANSLIVSELEKYGYPILSEEGADVSYDVRKHWQTYWCIDPLDGTKQFISKKGEFTVNISLIEHNIPVLGVIYVPVTDETYYAQKGKGAFIITDNKTLQLPLQEAPKDTVVASRSHMDEKTAQVIKEYNYTNIISKGSSIKFCLVAQGLADSYIRNVPTYEWDVTAASAILHEVGIHIVDIDTHIPFTYNRENLLNTGFMVQKRK